MRVDERALVGQAGCFDELGTSINDDNEREAATCARSDRSKTGRSMMPNLVVSGKDGRAGPGRAQLAGWAMGDGPRWALAALQTWRVLSVAFAGPGGMIVIGWRAGVDEHMTVEDWNTGHDGGEPRGYRKWGYTALLPSCLHASENSSAAVDNCDACSAGWDNWLVTGRDLDPYGTTRRTPPPPPPPPPTHCSSSLLAPRLQLAPVRSPQWAIIHLASPRTAPTLVPSLASCILQPPPKPPHTTSHPIPARIADCGCLVSNHSPRRCCFHHPRYPPSLSLKPGWHTSAHGIQPNSPPTAHATLSDSCDLVDLLRTRR